MKRGKIAVLLVIILSIVLMSTMAFASGKVLNIGGKNYVFIPKNEIPAGAHVLWVKSVQEFKALLARITITQSKPKPLYRKNNEPRLLSSLGSGILYDYAQVTAWAGNVLYYLTLNGHYYYSNGKVTSVQANILPGTSTPFWELVSSSKEVSPVGLNYAWASGSATFRLFIGIDPVGITVITRSLSVYDIEYVPN